MVVFIIYRAETETRRLDNMQRRAKLLAQLEGACSLPPPVAVGTPTALTAPPGW